MGVLENGTGGWMSLSWLKYTCRVQARAPGTMLTRISNRLADSPLVNGEMVALTHHTRTRTGTSTRVRRETRRSCSTDSAYLAGAGMPSGSPAHRSIRSLASTLRSATDDEITNTH